MSKEGRGQKKINQWTRLTTVPIALVQAIFIYTGVFPRPEEDRRNGRPPARSASSSPRSSRALLVMWIGELITEYGVGNGAS